MQLALKGSTAVASLVGRNPVLFGGSATFAVVFSFVAVNALYQQQGPHPSPMLRTRIPFATQLAVNPAGDLETLEPTKVTTFVIERENTKKTDAAQPATTATVAETPQPAVSPETVAAVQRELQRLALYADRPDGKMGPRTVAAIRTFQKTNGLAETGLADTALLAVLKNSRSGQAIALPAERPVESASASEEDPVAAAIRLAETGKVDKTMIPRAEIPAPDPMVMKIQKGLANLAYQDVVADGYAGAQTRAAVRAFQKHYRLKPTGEPDAEVLGKLKEIGAL